MCFSSNKYVIGMGCRLNKRIQIIVVIILVIIFYAIIKRDSYYHSRDVTIYLPSPIVYESFYGIIDAGSTGSRLYMYKVINGTNNSLEYLRFPDGSVVSHKITPGLSDFVDNIDGAVEYMLKLLKWLETNVDDEMLPKISISILATAGMRLLTYDQQINIVNKLKLELPSRSRCKISNIKVISGIMEGVYQWVANNHLRGNLDNSYRNYIPHLSTHTTIPSTRGIVELGGASLQIVYEKSTPSYYNQIFDYWNPNIRKYFKYKLHSESLLGYGLQTMFNWYLSPENYFSTYDEKSSCLPKNGHISIEFNNQVVTIIGSGNFELCLQSVEYALIESGKILKDNKNRLFFPKYNSTISTDNNNNIINFNIPPKMEFDGFSEVYYATYEFYNFQYPFNNENSKLYIQKAIEFCSSNYSYLQMKLYQGLYNTTNENNIISQCFKSSYILLLNKIICSKDNFITPRYKYNNKEVQWTYGALIDILSQSV